DLFRLREHLQQIGQRSHALTSDSRRPAEAEQERSMPSQNGGYDRQPGEIMVAHEKRVIVEHLRSGRLIVSVVQAHQSVSQKWGELAASVVRLLRGARRLDDLNEGSSGLQLGLAVIVATAGPGRPFSLWESLPRQ